MKKIIFISFIAITSSVFVFAQKQKPADLPQFTKAELLAYNDVRPIMSVINRQDYSKYLVRNFNIAVTITNTDGTQAKLSEMGPGGIWSEKQKNMIEKYAKQGVVFTIENIVMIEGGKKGLINQPAFSFSIKE